MAEAALKSGTTAASQATPTGGSAQFPNFEWPKLEVADQLHEFLELTSANLARTVSQCNTCLVEAGMSNFERAFKFARDFCAAKSPPEAVAVCNSYAATQFETLVAQTQQFSKLAQTFATDSISSITSVVPRIADATAASS